jgi:hypothetical protein
MSYRDEADRVVENALKVMGDLAFKALKAGDYGEAADIARVLEAVSAAIANDPSRAVPPEPRQAVEAPKSSKVIPNRGNGRSKGSSAAKRKTPTRRYPRFERDGDKLVKVGWSKTAGAEYEHRAPLNAVRSFARHLRESVGAGSVFVVEELMPVPISESEHIPAYQVYMALKWFQQIGAVEKKGRQGYLVRDASLSEVTVDNRWAALLSRSE